MTSDTQHTFQNVTEIPRLSHAEAGRMARVELERFLALLETLSEDDWRQPTYCTLWNVRQIVCHQAGAYAGSAGWPQFRRQWVPAPQPKPGQFGIDAVNDLQVADRSTAAPSDLIAELRQVGPKAIANRQRLPGVVRGLRFQPGPFLLAWRPDQMVAALRRPYGPTAVSFSHSQRAFQGRMRLDYITDLIYTRDTWMHRIDISLATGRAMVLTDDHDGRMLALVMRDLGDQLGPVLDRRTVAYDIPGTGGGRWKIGPGSTPEATIRMDLCYLNVLASGRISPDEARAQGLVALSGNLAAGNWALDHMFPLVY